MTSLINGIFDSVSNQMTYVTLLIVLFSLVSFALWRGRSAADRGIMRPLVVALTTFLSSRFLLITTGGAAEAYRIEDFVIFSSLNAVGYYGLAMALLKLLDTSDGVKTPTKARPAHSLANLTRQIMYFSLVGAFAYIVTPSSGSVFEFVMGMFNFMLIAATIRIVACILAEVGRYRNTLLPCAYGCVGLATVSWMLVEISPLMSESAAVLTIDISRFFDVVAGFFIVLNLITSYVRWGGHYRTQAIEQVKEMEVTKSELAKLSKIATNIYEDSSDIVRKQKEQTMLYMKKVENLEKMLQISTTIQRRQRLEDLLQMIVELIRDNLAFRTVTLRLFNRKAQNFETSAYVGLSGEVRDTVVNYRVPLAQYQKMIEPRFRISKSYFIKNTTPWYGEDLADDTVLVEDTWGEIDMLIVPLTSDEQETIGYLSVENPDDPKLSVADVIEALETIAELAVIAIRNARFFKELEVKNQKLRIYADKLSSLNKLKSNFVATISHEFRTPLTSIKAYCDTLLKNVGEVDRSLLKQFLVVIEEESERLIKLIEDILDFSQMETGALKFERSPCNVNELMQSATEELAKSFRSRKLTLHRVMPDSPVVIQAESDMIKQLMVNLLHNASKFTEDGGNVWLKLEEDAVCARIIVEDEGIGIPKDQLEKIFEQFHQVDNSSTRKYGGSGLGLAICRNIVEWHDGKIWVENIPDGGARFVVVIPKKQVVVKSHALEVGSTVRRFEVERFLELLVETVAGILNVQKASIMLLDEDRRHLRIECAIGLDEEIVERASVSIGRGISGKVAEEGRTMLVKNIEQDDRVARSNNELAYGSKSFLSVPIRSRGEVIGVINVASPSNKEALDDADARLLEMLVARISIAMERLSDFVAASMSYEQVRDTFKSILDAKRYIDLKDDEFITSLTIRTARKLGLTDDAISRLRYLLNVYDLGLSKIGYHIIKNPNELPLEDRREIEKHTVIGSDMLTVLESSPEIPNIVLCHHENFDGTGYPLKLAGDAVPIEARILRAVDSLRALVSQRPYQKQYTFSEALEVIRHRTGSFFDPRVVEALMAAIRDMTAGEQGAKTEDVENETVEKPN